MPRYRYGRARRYKRRRSGKGSYSRGKAAGKRIAYNRADRGRLSRKFSAWRQGSYDGYFKSFVPDNKLYHALGVTNWANLYESYKINSIVTSFRFDWTAALAPERTTTVGPGLDVSVAYTQGQYSAAGGPIFFYWFDRNFAPLPIDEGLNDSVGLARCQQLLRDPKVKAISIKDGRTINIKYTPNFRSALMTADLAGDTGEPPESHQFSKPVYSDKCWLPTHVGYVDNTGAQQHDGGLRFIPQGLCCAIYNPNWTVVNPQDTARMGISLMMETKWYVTFKGDRTPYMDVTAMSSYSAAANAQISYTQWEPEVAP